MQTESGSAEAEDAEEEAAAAAEGLVERVQELCRELKAQHVACPEPRVAAVLRRCTPRAQHAPPHHKAQQVTQPTFTRTIQHRSTVCTRARVPAHVSSDRLSRRTLSMGHCVLGS